jgi:hypothetical protein
LVEKTGRVAFQTGEDLSLMPMVPIHQDFAALALLNISHAERNGHHYSLGQGQLSAREKILTEKNHPELYTRRDGKLFLGIREGKVRCDSLQCPGFGVRFEPEWARLTPLDRWEVVW